MKSLKKVSAIFVSAALAMAMLVGCGAGSVGDQLRSETGAGAKGEVNQVASTLAEKNSAYFDALIAAVENITDDDVSADVTYAGTGIAKVDVEDADDGTQVGIYYAWTEQTTDDDALVASASAKFDALQSELDSVYDGIEYYIAASVVDEDLGAYVIVVYADFADATEK